MKAKLVTWEENYKNQWPEYCILTTLDRLISSIVPPSLGPGTRGLVACLAFWAALAWPSCSKTVSI